MELVNNVCSAINIMLVVVFSVFQLSYSQDQSNTHIMQLASALPGCYSNAKQYYTYAMSKTSSPPQKRSSLFLLRAEFYKLESPLLNDSLTIYFQNFIKSSKVPFSSGFYSFIPEPDSRNIRMKVYKFKGAVPGLKLSFYNYTIPDISDEARKLKSAFHAANLSAHASCDMVWKKTSLRTFLGVTPSSCLASLGKDIVRISVSMTLTSSRITLTEGWHNVDERTRVGQLKVPYILKRKSDRPTRLTNQMDIPTYRMKTTESHKPVDDSSKIPKSVYSSLNAQENLSLHHRRPLLTPRRSKEIINTYHRLSSINKKGKTENLSSYHRLTSIKSKGIRKNLSTHKKLRTLKKQDYHKTTRRSQNIKSNNLPNSKVKNRNRQNKSRKQRKLRKYSRVKSSLLAGQKVFYKADLSGCKMPAQVPIKRFSFGGEIKKFQIVREQRSRKRKTKIYFSSSKTSMSNRGVQFIQRELTLYRGGYIEVKVTKRPLDSTRLEKKYTFQCKIFNKKKRKGSVKFFTLKSPPPKEAKSLAKITKALGQGRELWLTADVSKCQGRLAETPVVVGSAISDYDLVNHGKTLELFLPLDNINTASSPQKSHMGGFVIKIFKNSDVIMTWVEASNEETDFKRKYYKFRPAYRCELSNSLLSQTNEATAGSVGVFIR